MFKWIIERPITLYGFFSGIFLSIATTALSNFALAADAPANTSKLIKSAAVSFVAACLWFLIGEYVTYLKDRQKGIQDAASGSRGEAYHKSLEVLQHEVGTWLFILLSAAVLCSVLWPFV